jgi:tRNA threonylcarbamoyladenosine biosynthesis protein TsaE
MILSLRKIQVDGEDAMVALGKRLAAAMAAPMIVYLQGDLGMGKTTLARGVARGLGHTGAVKSPTYTLVEPYEFGELMLYHFDLYRLGDPEELEYMGIRDYFTEQSISLVEWPECGSGFLPPPDLLVRIERQGTGRHLAFEAHSQRGVECLECLPLEPERIMESGA